MQSFNILILFLLVTMASSQFTLIQTDKKLSNDGHMTSNKPTESIPKKKTITDNTIPTTKYGIVKDLKKINNQLVSTLLDAEKRLSAIKVIKFALLHLLSTQIQSTMDNLHKMDIRDLLESPTLNFILEDLLPMLSENDGRKICDVLYLDLPDSNNAWPNNNNLKTPETREAKPIKSLFENPSSATSKEPSVRKILK